MLHVGPEGLTANAMLDDMRRKKNAVTLFRGPLPENEILGEKLAKLLEPAHTFNHFPPSGDRRTKGEFHSLKHTSHKNTTQKLGVHADGLEARP